MFIPNERNALRQYYFTVWQKYHNNQPLDPLEQQIATVIQEHPEYHRYFADPNQNLDKDFDANLGFDNPFLHLGLHLGLREQIATDRPVGIQQIFQILLLRYNGNSLLTEHMMMEKLAEFMERNAKGDPFSSMENYLEALKKL